MNVPTSQSIGFLAKLPSINRADAWSRVDPGAYELYQHPNVPVIRTVILI